MVGIDVRVAGLQYHKQTQNPYINASTKIMAFDVKKMERRVTESKAIIGCVQSMLILGNKFLN